MKDKETEVVTGELVDRPAEASALVPAATAAVSRGKKAASAQKHLEFVARLDGRVRSKHTQIVEKVALAAKIDTGAPKPAGWTDEEYRIAQDARNGPREAPMYLSMAQKIVDSYKRAETMAERDPAPVLNCDIQVFVQKSYHYEVIEAEKE